jgi:hypothetical protein
MADFFHTAFNSFIFFIVVIKILFVFFAFLHFIDVFESLTGTDFDEKILFWKERSDFIFTMAMSLVLIILFYKRSNTNVYISKEVQFLLLTNGIISILTADWTIFVKQSELIKRLQSLFNLPVKKG